MLVELDRFLCSDGLDTKPIHIHSVSLESRLLGGSGLSPWRHPPSWEWKRVTQRTERDHRPTGGFHADGVLRGTLRRRCSRPKSLWRTRISWAMAIQRGTGMMPVAGGMGTEFLSLQDIEKDVHFAMWK